MTLDELQVVIVANISQLAPQMREAQKYFNNLSKTAETSGKDMEKSVTDSAAKTEKALDSENKAQDKSANETKKSTESKKQSLQEIAAIAQAAAQRYNDSFKSMGDTGPLHEPMKLSGAAGTASERANQAATPEQQTSTEPQLNALQRLQQQALKVRQPLLDMFTGAKQGSAETASAVQELVAKLDNINARADIQRMKLSEMQAQYQRISSGAGGMNSPEAIKLQGQILATESRLQSLAMQSDKTVMQIDKLNSALKSTSKSATAAGSSAEKASFGFKKASGGASQFSKDLDRMRRQILSQILIYGLLMKGLSAVGTYMWSALKTNTAFANSLNNLKVQMLTAFSPIYQAMLPALTSLINALARTMSYVAAFISGFFGKTYAQSKQSAAGLNDNVKALQDMEKAAKDTKKSLAGFDQINQLSKSSSASANTAKDASLINTDFGAASAKPLIGEQQIAQAEAAGERVRKIFDKIYSFAKKYEGPIKAIVLGIVGAFLLFKTISFVSGIVESIGGAIAFLVANPEIAIILAIAIAVAALAVGLVYLYNTNKQFHDGVNQMWKEIQQTFQTAYNNVIKPIIDNAAKVIDQLWTEHIKPLWDQIKVFGVQLLNDLQPIVDFLIKVLGPVVVAVVNTIVTIIGDVFGVIVDIVKDVIKILGGLLDFLAGVFTGNWSKAWKGIQEIFGGVWDLIRDIVTGVVKTIGDVVGGLVDTVKGAFQGLWNGITSIFSGAGDWFAGIWNSIGAGAKSGMNDIIGFINDAIKKIDGFGFNMPSQLGGARIGFDIPQIPRLATGGITGINSPMLAMIGDNKTQREVVSPLGDLQAMIVKAVQGAGGGNSRDINITMPVYLDSSGSLITTIVKKINQKGANSGQAVFA